MPMDLETFEASLAALGSWQEQQTHSMSSLRKNYQTIYQSIHNLESLSFTSKDLAVFVWCMFVCELCNVVMFVCLYAVCMFVCCIFVRA
jgi:hypothetical protein